MARGLSCGSPPASRHARHPLRRRSAPRPDPDPRAPLGHAVTQLQPCAKAGHPLGGRVLRQDEQDVSPAVRRESGAGVEVGLPSRHWCAAARSRRPPARAAGLAAARAAHRSARVVSEPSRKTSWSRGPAPVRGRCSTSLAARQGCHPQGGRTAPPAAVLRPDARDLVPRSRSRACPRRARGGRDRGRRCDRHPRRSRVSPARASVPGPRGGQSEARGPPGSSGWPATRCRPPGGWRAGTSRRPPCGGGADNRTPRRCARTLGSGHRRRQDCPGEPGCGGRAAGPAGTPVHAAAVRTGLRPARVAGHRARGGVRRGDAGGRCRARRDGDRHPADLLDSARDQGFHRVPAAQGQRPARRADPRPAAVPATARDARPCVGRPAGLGRLAVDPLPAGDADPGRRGAVRRVPHVGPWPGGADVPDPVRAARQPVHGGPGRPGAARPGRVRLPGGHVAEGAAGQPDRGGAVAAGAVGGAGVPDGRPAADAQAAGRHRGGGPDQGPGAVQGVRHRGRGGDAAPDRAGPARRRPGRGWSR